MAIEFSFTDQWGNLYPNAYAMLAEMKVRKGITAPAEEPAEEPGEDGPGTTSEVVIEPVGVIRVNVYPSGDFRTNNPHRPLEVRRYSVPPEVMKDAMAEGCSFLYEFIRTKDADIGSGAMA